MINHYDRVKEYISTNNMLQPGETVVLAVSGGPDSLCLLYLMKDLAMEWSLTLIVAHLNHCLRPEGPEEEKGVASIARSLGLLFESKAVDINLLRKEIGVGEEEAGRRARYQFLREVASKYKAAVIATGHHRDDQAETVMLNILRGSGLDGLAGIIPVSTRGGLRLIRPLLCLWRREIESFCRDRELKPFSDSSNLETGFRRNKIRLELFPQLEKDYNPRIKDALAGMADLVRDDRFYLNRLAGKLYNKLVRSTEMEIRINLERFNKLEPALQGRILRIALSRLSPESSCSRNQIKRLLSFIKEEKAGLTLEMPGLLTAWIHLGEVILSDYRVLESHKISPVLLPVPGKINLPGNGVISAELVTTEQITWPPGRNTAYLDYDSLPDKELQVRSRQKGDRFHPQGAGGAKKLKGFLIDQKIPRHKRDELPLVVVSGEIIWVAGVRIAESNRIREDTKRVLKLQYLAVRRKIRKDD